MLAYLLLTVINTIQFPDDNDHLVKNANHTKISISIFHLIMIMFLQH